MIQVEDLKQEELSLKKKNKSPIIVKENAEKSPILNIKMFNIESDYNEIEEK